MSSVKRAPKAKKWLRSDLYINREFSLLQFNGRVLHEAANPENPILERARFLSIFESNIDEFYMVRVSGLIEQFDSSIHDLSPDGLTPEEQLHLIAKTVKPLRARAAEILKGILSELRDLDVQVLGYSDLSKKQRRIVDDAYRATVFPLLTPLILAPAPSLPFISSRSLNLAVRLKEDDNTRLARVKVPNLLPRLMRVGKKDHVFVLLEDVIRNNIGALFPGVKVEEAHLFRVVRDADIEIRQVEAGDLLFAVEQTIKDRRFGDPVQLEVSSEMSEGSQEELRHLLELRHQSVFVTEGLIGLDALSELASIDRPDLRFPRHHPYLAECLSSTKSIFETLDAEDVLLHHPFDSFLPVQQFVDSAATDPDVLGIKMTLYRVGSKSPIVESLLAAAEAGKQVAVTVEVRARFDESNNLGWARALERAGVHVSYGFPDLKTHCKLCIVVRKHPDGTKTYTHIGTGNYNPFTAQLYTDLGLITADPEIALDAADLFNYLTGYSKQRTYRKLLVAPHTLREGIIDAIEREIKHPNGRIIFKMNSLVDPEIIAHLYEASEAGVKVDLIIRGISSLRPQHDALSKEIHVRSIVGRFLEHSRILYFGNNGDPRVYIGSSDAMRRNLDRRIEVLVPIESDKLCAHIHDHILSAYLRDTANAWLEQDVGTYKRLHSTRFSAQEFLAKHPSTSMLLPCKEEN